MVARLNSDYLKITVRLNISLSKLLFTTSFSSSCKEHGNTCDRPRGKNTKLSKIHISIFSPRAILDLLERIKCQKFIAQLKQIQSLMVTSGLILDGYASSRLVAAFCANTDDLHHCTKIVQNNPNPNAFSYNLVIRAYGLSQSPRVSIFLYKHMLETSSTKYNNALRPDKFTFPLLFKVSAKLLLFYMGHEVLVHVTKMGFESDVFVHNSLIHFLVSCGELESANKVFTRSCVRDLVSWNSLINGYVRRGRPLEALRTYRKMETEGFEPDEVTMIGVVSSCSQLEDLELGRAFHRGIIEKGMNMSVRLYNVLMDMYVKCGDLEEAKVLFDGMWERTIVTWTIMVVGYAKYGLLDDARRILDKMPEQSVFSWNALIGGYVQARRGKEALALFHEMQATGVRPDEVTMVNCLSACSQLGALDVGIWIHRYIERHGLSVNVTLGTALVDMYAKCGSITRALQLFNEIPCRNSLTWTVMICGLALHGDASSAISLFSEMIDIGLLPDEITFLGVLSACCHGGFVEEGRKIFTQMISKFTISPQVKHYACMVDLLGRANYLEEAEELISCMPMEPDAGVWGALFFAARTHGNVKMGERAALELLKLDPDDSGIYVLLANMYIEAHMWQKARDMRKMMIKRGLEKIPGCSSIELNGEVREFIVTDVSHPQSNQMYECLRQLRKQMELAPHVASPLEDDTYSTLQL